MAKGWSIFTLALVLSLFGTLAAILQEGSFLKRVSGCEPTGTTTTFDVVVADPSPRELPPIRNRFSWNSTDDDVADDGSPSTTNASHHHYCVITKDAMWPGVCSSSTYGWRRSVAHSAEALFGCWSWFQAVGATNETRALLIADGLMPDVHTWTRQLMDAMNCQVYMYNALGDLEPFSHDRSFLLGVNRSYQPYFVENHWLDSRADAQNLRKLILPDLFPSGEDTAAAASPVRVGILERDNNRHLSNLTELEAALQAIPNVQTTVIRFTAGVPMKDQARWFATQDIIVAAHGAGLTNAVVLRPGSTVIQIYPYRYYFMGYFESLVTKAGGFNMHWYPVSRKNHAECSHR